MPWPPLLAFTFHSVPDSINSALLHVPAWIMSTLFLIVHHPGSFPSAQHKAVCILLLKVICGRPSLLIPLVRSASLFARPPHSYTGLLKVFHLLHSIRLFCQLSRFKTHTARWYGELPSVSGLACVFAQTR